MILHIDIHTTYSFNTALPQNYIFDSFQEKQKN